MSDMTDEEAGKMLSLLLSKVNRFEAITYGPEGQGRQIVHKTDTPSVSASLQDDGRTLKVFLNTTNVRKPDHV